MIRSESAGGVVLNNKQEVALVLNGPGYWGLPKGHIDPGESPLQAAIREIAEETGLVDLELKGELPSYERFRGFPDGSDDMRELKTIYMFLFFTRQQELRPLDDSNPEARWFSIKDIARRLTHPKDRIYFESILPLVGRSVPDIVTMVNGN